MTANHTPGPWHVTHRPDLKAHIIFADNERMILTDKGTTLPSVGQAYTEDNAAFIVRACNAHDELLAALERTLPWLGRLIADGGHLNCAMPRDAEMALLQATEAIRKAKGETA